MTEMKFTKQNVKAIVKLLRTVDADARVLPDYSGRFMYGATCVGFVAHTAVLVIAAVVDVMGKEGFSAIDIASEMFTDDFGRGTIGYFPDVVSELEASE